jgi:hypothetical protein
MAVSMLERREREARDKGRKDKRKIECERESKRNVDREKIKKK